MSPVMQGTFFDTSEEPFCPCRWIWQRCSCHSCSGEEKRFGSHVSICAEVISPTSAACSDWRQHQLRTEAFELRRGAVARPLSRQDGDSECPVVAIPRFRFCGARVCDQMPHALRPRAAEAIEEATNTSRAAPRPGTAAVVKLSAGLACEAVSPLGSAVMPGSASFKPHTTA